MSAQAAISNRKKTLEGKNKELIPITICTGAFCSIKSRADHLDILRELQLAAEFLHVKISVSKTDCLGLCSKSPAVRVGDQIYSKLTIPDIKRILTEQTKELTAISRN